MSTSEKLNFLSINSIYLISSSLEMQRRLIQTIVYCKFFYSVWKETANKLSEKATAKAPFSTVYIIDTTCFDECCLFHMITGRYYFLYKVIVTKRFCTVAMLLRSLRWVFWKKSLFYTRYLLNNIPILLIPKVQIPN